MVKRVVNSLLSLSHDVTFDVEQPGLDKAAIGGLACEEEDEKEDSAEDSSSSSDDESSSSSVNAEELHSKINGDCYVKHTSERCFQNRKTKMLHRPGKFRRSAAMWETLQLQ